MKYFPRIIKHYFTLCFEKATGERFDYECTSEIEHACKELTDTLEDLERRLEALEKAQEQFKVA